ncbi:MAG: hypothetical protein ACRDAU_01015 [Clostridium sp.]
MKKILVVILLSLTSLTMYFMFIWEPGSIESSAGNEESTSIEEIEEKKISDKEKRKQENSLRELEEKRKKDELREIEEKKYIEIEESKARILRLKKNITEDDKVKINKKLETLSTIDLMKVDEALKEGDIRKAMELMKIRMLESDWKSIYEIFEKYKAT